MHTLRKDQIDLLLSRCAEEGLFEALKSYLRATCMEEVAKLTCDELRERIEVGIRRARAYDITWESKIAVFLGLMFTVGPGFDRHPWIRRVLRNPRLDGNAKLDELTRVTPDRFWAEARRLRDPADWSRDGLVELEP